MQFLNSNVERLKHARLDRGFPFDDGLVDLGTAIDVIRFGSKQLLQDVSSTVCFECPDFHFSEALSAELRLAPERLLRNQRIRSNRSCVNLVIDQVRQLEHVDIADRYRLLELV